MLTYNDGKALDVGNSGVGEFAEYRKPVLSFPRGGAGWELILHITFNNKDSIQNIFGCDQSSSKKAFTINATATNCYITDNTSGDGPQRRYFEFFGREAGEAIPAGTKAVMRLVYTPPAEGQTYGFIEMFSDTGFGMGSSGDPQSFTGMLTGLNGQFDPDEMFNGSGDDYYFSYLKLTNTTSDTVVNEYDPNYVSDGAGNYVLRDSTEAESGSDLLLYDKASGEALPVANATWVSTVSVVDINGEAYPTIALDSTGNTAQVSGITPTSVSYGADEVSSVPVDSFSVSGSTVTFDLALTESADYPVLGEINLYVSDGVTTASRSFVLDVPTSLSTQNLVHPIEVDEKAFGFGEPWSEEAGGRYYYDPTYIAWAQNDELSNVAEPVAPPPWSTVVWYHGKDGGMTQINTTSGDFEQSNNPPTVDAGTTRTVTVPDTVQLGTNVNASDSDGSIASYAWNQESGPSVSINNSGVKNASVALTEAGTYVFRVTVADDDGATAFDDLTVTANEAVTDSTLNLTVTGIGSSTEQVVLHDRADNSVVYTGTVTFTNDVGSVTLTDVDVGTEVYGVWFGANPPVTGTGLYGVTE